MRLSMRWAARCREAFVPRDGHGLFGIVQGSTYPELRAESVAALTGIGFEGYAVGGLAVGEGQAMMFDVLDSTVPLLPPDAARYLMGVGTPSDLVGAVRRGIDMFDCVMPTRSGRTGRAYTRRGVLNMRNARHADDGGPIDPDCSCPACARHSRAYIHHLFKAGEMLGPMLLTWHNIQYYQDLMRGAARGDPRRHLRGNGGAHRGRLARGRGGEGGMSGGPDHEYHALTQLGRPTALPASPAEAVLEKVRAPHPDLRYCVRFTAPEFTSLCPLTGQPDFAHLVIDYVPGGWIVESKSLKNYLASFRNHGAFHEACTLDIAQRLVALLAPVWLRIGGYWYPRGGIPIDVFWQIRRGAGGGLDPGAGRAALSWARLRPSATQALALGFDAVGFARAHLAPEVRARLMHFLAEGRHGSMGWMADRAEQRAHPRALWPEAVSVVVLGLNYGPDGDPLETLAQRDRATISVYARNRDYHDVVKKRLKALGRWMAETWPGSGHQGVRRHRAGRREAAGAGGRARLAGQAHQPRLARAGVLAVPGRGVHHPRPRRGRGRDATIAGPAAPASMPARPTPSPRPMNSMRGAASPT